jgi:CheY-like chemotaxis protein
MADRRILVVEDEYVVARDIAEELERAGAEVVGPVATPDSALRLVDREGRLDAAVLDVKLNGGAVYAVAEALRQRGVPFILATAYEREALAPALRDAAICEKPFEARCIIDALRRRLARAPDRRAS